MNKKEGKASTTLPCGFLQGGREAEDYCRTQAWHSRVTRLCSLVSQASIPAVDFGQTVGGSSPKWVSGEGEEECHRVEAGDQMSS